MRDLEIIIVLVLLTFNFIPQRSHQSLTLPRSRISDSATVTLTPGDGTTAIKMSFDYSLCFDRRSFGQNKDYFDGCYDITLMAVHNSQLSSITDQLIFQNGKNSEVHRRNNNGPKTLLCVIPDTTLPVYSDNHSP